MLKADNCAIDCQERGRGGRNSRERKRERKREDLAFPDIRGVSVTAIIVLQRLLKGRAAIQTSIKAELSSAQVTGCT